MHRVISKFLIKRSSRKGKSGTRSGAVTLIQRFGSALNLNLHFHMRYLNGIYDASGYFWPVKPPTPEDLDTITYTIAKCASRNLEQAGYLSRDAESGYLNLMPHKEDAMHGIISASTDASDRTYRLACGSNQGRKALTLQAVLSGGSMKKASELVSNTR